MNYIKIDPYDIANGPGCRVTLWVSGCEHHCSECHNPDTWNFNSGGEFTGTQISQIIALLDKPHIAGLSITGGDPLAPQNIEDIFHLLKCVKIAHPEKSIWIWSGYTFEELMSFKDYDIYLSWADVLVDGPYIKEKKNLSLKYRGSSNQRIIDIQQTLLSNSIVEKHDI